MKNFIAHASNLEGRANWTAGGLVADFERVYRSGRFTNRNTFRTAAPLPARAAFLTPKSNISTWFCSCHGWRNRVTLASENLRKPARGFRNV
jgi:hypothetical protein